MKKSMIVGTVVLGLGMSPGILARTACELVPEAQAQTEGCLRGLEQDIAQASSMKEHESRLIAALQEDTVGALARCEQDLVGKDAAIDEANAQLQRVAFEQEVLIAEQKGIDYLVRERVIWECALIDLKYGTATVGVGRTQEEARLAAWNKGNFKNHGDHAACYQRLEEGAAIR